MNEKISVIVPVYNTGKYLGQCIGSIVSQTYKNLEIIIVDDGSDDGSTASLCELEAGKDARIKVLHKQNGGLSDARNAGIDASCGEFLSFIDSDDHIAPEMLGTMLSDMLEASCDIAVCNILRCTESGETTPFYRPADRKTVLAGNDRFKTLLQPSVCNRLFRRELFDAIRFPKGKYYEDTFVCHELLYASSGAVLTGKDDYFYLSRDESITGSSRRTERYFDMVEAVWKRAVFLSEKGVEGYDLDACLSLYAAYANAVSAIKVTSTSKELFRRAKEEYKFAYGRLTKEKNGVGAKQRLRLFLLRYAPQIHRMVY